MSRDPRAVALGDQIHAEIMDRASMSVRNLFTEEGITLSDDALDAINIGVQAGLHTALQVLLERDWIRIP
jgi:hypothetical protein